MDTTQPSPRPRTTDGPGRAPVRCPEGTSKPVLFKGARVAGLLLLGAAAALLGCQQDEIRHYQAPKAEQRQVRMLVALVPHGGRTWFFKMTGPQAAVDEHKGEFDQFLASVHFTGKAEPPVEWKVPEGWQQAPGDPVRYATFRVGPAELSVTSLGETAGSLLDNVNRWRGQVGLDPIKEDKLDEVTSKTKVDGDPATVVDLTGPGGKGPKMPPFMAGGGGGGVATAPASRGVPEYTAPEGWEKQPPPITQFAVAELKVSEGGRTATVTITPAGGDVLGNVNRWRTLQLGLPPVTEEQLRRDARPVEVDGSPGQFVDLAGPESAGGRRILGVIVPRGGVLWFFKMQGPADLVEKQKAAFEAFVKSVHFGASPGGEHE